jgi:hypothetical protein
MKVKLLPTALAFAASLACFGVIALAVVPCWNCPTKAACATSYPGCGGAGTAASPCTGMATVTNGNTAYECIFVPGAGAKIYCASCTSAGGVPGPVVPGKCTAPNGSVSDGHTFVCANTYNCTPSIMGGCTYAIGSTGTVNADNIMCY